MPPRSLDVRHAESNAALGQYVTEGCHAGYALEILRVCRQLNPDWQHHPQALKRALRAQRQPQGLPPNIRQSAV